MCYTICPKCKGSCFFKKSIPVIGYRYSKTNVEIPCDFCSAIGHIYIGKLYYKICKKNVKWEED